MDSVTKAIEDVRLGKLFGYMAFPQNYSLHMVNRGMLGKLSDNLTIEGSTIAVQGDFSSTELHIQYYSIKAMII